MAWQTVAEGTSIQELSQTVADMKLAKGTKLKAVIDTPFEWVFDFIAAEWAFEQVLPDDVKVLDVYGEDGQGIVDMEITGTFLTPILLFIRAHWASILIATFVLGTIVTFIRILMKVPIPAGMDWLIIGGAALGIVGLLVLVNQKARSP